MARIEYIIKRLFHSFIVLFIIVTVVFFIPRLSSKSPLDLFSESPSMSEEMIQAMMVRFGLDKPVWEQYYLYLINLFRGDMGVSFYHYPEGVFPVVMERLPWTLFLVGISTLLRTLIGITLGIYAAWRRGTAKDISVQTLSLALLALPTFWIAMVSLLVFAVYIPYFPTAGAVTTGATYSNALEFVADIAHHAFLPMLIMVFGMLAGSVIMMRNVMVDVLDEDYVITAHAKGLSDREVEYRHAARTALLPSVTYIALTFGMVVSGSVYVETVFSYPGMGRLLFRAVLQLDYPLLQGVVLISSVFVVASNFLVDIIYGYLDPRVKD